MDTNNEFWREMTFDKTYDRIQDYILYYDYNQDDGIYVDIYNIDADIEVTPLVDLGYDFLEDGTLYRDENGRPVNDNPNPHIHLAEDITMIDEETGERIPNAEYISMIVNKFL